MSEFCGDGPEQGAFFRKAVLTVCGGSHKLGVPFSGVPITETIICLGLHWGPLFMEPTISSGRETW